MLKSLVFPYSQSTTLRVSLQRVHFTTRDDTQRVCLDLSADKSVESLTVIDTAKPESSSPFEYIDNHVVSTGHQDLLIQIKTPLVLKVPADFIRLKLLITVCGVLTLDTKSLVIVKNKDVLADEQTLRSYTKGIDVSRVELSRIDYSSLPLDPSVPEQRITINDSFNLSGFIDISLWEHDTERDQYAFLFDFGFFREGIFQNKSTSPTISATPFIGSSFEGIANTPGASPVEPPNPIDFTSSAPTLEDVKLSVDIYRQEFAFILDDGPEFRLKISRYETNFHQYKKAMRALLEELRTVEMTLKKLAHSRSRLIELLSIIIDTQGPLILRLLKFINEFEHRMRNTFDGFERNLRFLVEEVFDVSTLRKIGQTLANQLLLAADGPEGNELCCRRKRFETCSKDYYLWLNKYLSNEKDRPESKLLAKRQQFELAKYNYMNLLDQVTNNQYATGWLANLFRFLQLGWDPERPHYLAYRQFRDAKPREQLLADKYAIYLHAVLIFNSEKTKLRQMIEALRLNPELTTVMKYNRLNPHNSDSERSEVVTPENLDAIFEAPPVLTQQPPVDAGADMLSLLYALGGQGKLGWHKEWVVLKNGLLMEYSDWRKGSKPINLPIAIALASIKATTHEKRQNCFAITTSTGNKHVFQAISADERDKWIKSLYQAGQVVSAPSRRPKNLLKIKTESELQDITNPDLPVSILLKRVAESDYVQLVRRRPEAGNALCADCGSGEGVEWVAINLLVCVCVACALCHRSLGSHISKIRSLKLDKFEAESCVLLSFVDNKYVNKFLEATDPRRPSTDTPHIARLEFIRNKYAMGSYRHQVLDVDNKLISAVQLIDIPSVLKAILSGANVNLQLQISVSDKNGPCQRIVLLFEYLLRKSIIVENETRPMYCVSELLLANGCSIDELPYNKDIGLSRDALEYWKGRREKLGS